MKCLKFILSLIFIISILCHRSILLSQDYSKLEINETIEVNYEPFDWEINSPKDFGIDTIHLNSFLNNISKWENLRSILVIREGKIILEKYLKDRTKYSAFNVFSITKSITSTLIGIAKQNGLIDSEDLPVIDFFPEYNTKLNDDKKQNITIKNLLTMTSGIEPNEWWNPNIEYALLDAPIKYLPGQKFLYYNALPNLLSAIITKTSNLSTKDFAEKYLFEPLGMTCAYWSKNEDFYSGRSNTYYTPRDLARLGSLYLNNGKVNGVQIISTEWIDKTFRNYAESDENFFLTGHPFNQTGYGYLWWITKSEDLTFFTAYGAGDQFLILNPEYNTIVVISQIYTDTWFDKKEDIDLLTELLTIIHN